MRRGARLAGWLPLVAVLGLALGALPAPASAQATLRSCLDEDQPAQARVETCSTMIQAARNDATRALALFGRAQAGMDILSARQDPPPPSAYDPLLADLDLSLATFRSTQALTLRAIVRFWRGDLAPSVMPLYRGGEWEAAGAALGPMIAAAPGNPDLLILRSTFRALTGDAAGARADRAEAARIAGQAP